MASYFAKMTFFKNLQKDTWCQKNKFFCFQLKKYAYFFLTNKNDNIHKNEVREIR